MLIDTIPSTTPATCKPVGPFAEKHISDHRDGDQQRNTRLSANANPSPFSRITRTHQVISETKQASAATRTKGAPLVA